ncbi:hypothetical protein [Paracoccus caeni]|uniref:hypothetical protein n=1 Tax=Paracoccus caeni TaxID=657651 RepID=UPI001F293772|nr:hypothetical protein [Paracoccus caeni]
MGIDRSDIAAISRLPNASIRSTFSASFCAAGFAAPAFSESSATRSGLGLILPEVVDAAACSDFSPVSFAPAAFLAGAVARRAGFGFSAAVVGFFVVEEAFGFRAEAVTTFVALPFAAVVADPFGATLACFSSVSFVPP